MIKNNNMSLKFAAFFGVVLVVVLTQGTSASKVDDLLKKLREEVDNGMAKAQKALDDAKNKVNQIADSIQNSAKAEMQSTLDKLKAELDKLKEKAKKAGVNIDECLGADEQQLLNLPNKLAEDMTHCVSDKINQGIGYAQDALNQVQKIVDEVENIKQEIKDCGHGFSSVKCLAKLAIKIEEDIVSLPTKIEADVAATVVLITQLEDKVKECASNKVDQLESDGKTILERITLCVGKKIIL